MRIDDINYQHSQTSKKKLSLYFVYLILLIDSLALGLITPTLSVLFTDEQFGFKLDVFDISKEHLYGLSLSSFRLAVIICVPIFGVISDIYDKNKVILYGLVGIFLSYLISIIAITIQSALMFLCSRFIYGAFYGIYAASQALISDISFNQQKRMAGLKVATTAVIIGIMLGQGVLIFIVDIIKANNHVLISFITASVLSILNIILIVYVFKSNRVISNIIEVHTSSNNKVISQINKNLISFLLFYIKLVYLSLTGAFNFKKLNTLIFSYLFCQLGYGLFYNSFPYYLSSHQCNTSQIANIFLIIITIEIFSMYSLQRLFSKYLDYKKQTISALIIMGTLLILASLKDTTIFRVLELENLSFILIIIFLFYIFYPFITIGFNNLFINSANKNEQGKLIGVRIQLLSISWFISGFIMGDLLKHYSILLLVSGSFFILSFLLLKRFLKA